MKSKLLKIILLTLLTFSSISLVGCSSKEDDSATNNGTENSASDSTNIAETQNNQQMVDLGTDKITLKLAETKNNSELEEMIKTKLNLSDDVLSKTQYYYNYVDLNDDGVDEIFVEVVLPTDSNTGTNTTNNNNTMGATASSNDSSGNVGLIYTTEDGKLKEIDHFTMIQNPIIISDNKTNGWKDILVLSNNSTNNMTNNNTSDITNTNTADDVTGNNTTDKNSMGNNTTVNSTEYTVLTYDGDSYTDIDDATTFVPLDNITGVAVIANDLSINTNSGIYLSK